MAPAQTAGGRSISSVGRQAYLNLARKLLPTQPRSVGIERTISCKRYRARDLEMTELRREAIALRLEQTDPYLGW
jgi:hypothetical protein